MIKPADVVEVDTETTTEDSAPHKATETGQMIVDSEECPDDTSVLWRNSKTDRLYEFNGTSWVPYEDPAK